MTIVVRDHGIGVQEKNLDRIFGAFKRVHSRTEYPGSGIGLALTQKIVHLHEGSISVTSTYGEGTVFSVTLPMRRDVQSAPHEGEGRADPEPDQHSEH